MRGSAPAGADESVRGKRIRNPLPRATFEIFTYRREQASSRCRARPLTLSLSPKGRGDAVSAILHQAEAVFGYVCPSALRRGAVIDAREAEHAILHKDAFAYSAHPHAAVAANGDWLVALLGRSADEIGCSAFVDDQGQAMGVIVTIAIAPFTASNGVTDLDHSLRYLDEHTDMDVHLALGTQSFEDRLVPPPGERP